MPFQDFIPKGQVPGGGEGDGFRDFIPESEIDRSGAPKIVTGEPLKELITEPIKGSGKELSEEDLEDMGIEIIEDIDIEDDVEIE